MIDSEDLRVMTYDPKDYVGPCVYVIRLCKYTYKFGMTMNMPSRYSRHKRDFNNRGLTIEIVKLFRCGTRGDARAVESELKKWGERTNILIEMFDQTEILYTRNIDAVCAEIGNYVCSITKNRISETQRLLDAASTDLESETCEARQLELRREIIRLNISMPTTSPTASIVRTIHDLSSVPKTHIGQSDYWEGRYMGYDVIGYGTSHINGTKLCKSIRRGIKAHHWATNSDTFELVTMLAHMIDVPYDALIRVHGGNNDLRGTYIHCILIPTLLRWISPEFAVLEIVYA